MGVGRFRKGDRRERPVALLPKGQKQVETRSSDVSWELGMGVQSPSSPLGVDTKGGLMKNIVSNVITADHWPLGNHFHPE